MSCKSPPRAIKSLSNKQLINSRNRWETEIESAHAALDTKKFDSAHKQLLKIKKEIKLRGI